MTGFGGQRVKQSHDRYFKRDFYKYKIYKKN